MEIQCKVDNSETLTMGVFELPGEPAMVINGVPPVTNSDGDLILRETVSGIELPKKTIFGEWLVGRKVQKLFGGKVHGGKVIKFDKESSWYRVRYDDGNFEDLEWHELQKLLLPLDVAIPLKKLLSKVIKKSEKQTQKSLSRPTNQQPEEGPAKK